MKKLITLFGCLILCSACFNYIEINDLVLINGIGIDYKDGKFHVSVEALYQNKENSDSNFEWGQVSEVMADSLSDAFNRLSLKLQKNPYYAHLKILIISEEIARNHFNDLIDYYLRNNDIRNIFSLVVSDDISPKELLSSSSKYYPVVSERLRELLENNKYKNYIVYNLYFKDIASNYLTNNKDIVLTMIGLENKNPIISKLLVFSNKSSVGYLDKNKATTLSIINNSKPNVLIKHECNDNKYITINIYKSKNKFGIYKNSFNINAELSAEIIENNCNIDLENDKDYKKLTKEFEKIITSDYQNLINELQKLNSDLLGINKKYFNKYRSRNYDYFKNSKYSINSKLEINKKGLIFEVNSND